MLLFLGKLNTAISVILAIPIALSASPVLYKLAGFSFNLVSLLALIIAIGIVVDDSIVVSENVERYRAMGFSLKESVLKGASEVFSAVVAASLSLLSVLLPVSFIGGFIGAYLQQFSLGLAAAVAFSLLEAVLFLTVRLAYTPEIENPELGRLRASWIQLPDAIRWGLRVWRKALGIIVGVVAVDPDPRDHAPARPPSRHGCLPDRAGSRVLRGADRPCIPAVSDNASARVDGSRPRMGARSPTRGPSAASCTRVSGFSSGPPVFLVGVVVFVAPHIAFNFVPNTDSGILNINLRNPPGTPLQVTNDGIGRIESYLRQQPEVVTVQAVIGSSPNGVSGIFSGTNTANMVVQMTPVQKRTNVYQLIPRYRAGILSLFHDQPSAQVLLSAGGGFGPGGSTLQLSLVSSDFNLLLQRNGRILQTMVADPWVSDVYSSLSDTSLENDFVPDPSRMKGTGISPAMIAGALQTYASGVQASSVVSGGLSYPIQVQADPTALSGAQSLLNLPIYSPLLQTTVQVGQLGSFSLNQAPVSLSRYNRSYTGNFTISMKPGRASGPDGEEPDNQGAD